MIHAALVLAPIDQPIATGSFACADVDGGAPIHGLDANGNSPSGPAVQGSIDALQTGMLAGFARVIVYFSNAVPHYSLREFHPPVFATRTDTGDADDVRLRGEYGLAIAMTWADSQGRDGRGIDPIGAIVVEGRLWDTGDQIALLGLGLSRETPFRVSTFTLPARLVIDVASAPAACAAP